MARLEAALRSYGFGVLVLALEVWLQAELVVHDSEWDPALAAAGLLVPLPLLARARAPFVAPLVVQLGAALIAAKAPDVAFDVAAQFFGFCLATFVLAQNRDARLAVAGLAVALADISYVVLRDPEEGGGDYVWIGLFVTTVWISGFVFSQRSREVERARAHARRFEEQAKRAADEERRRIARELHDVVAHSISVMTVQAGAVRRLLHDGQAREREALTAVEATGRQALAEMRRMLGMLQESGAAGGAPREPQPGMGSLAALIGRVRDSGLPVDYRVKGEPLQLPPGIDVSAYRIVQDALSNAAAERPPSGARVEVRWGADALELEVSHEGGVDGDGDPLAGVRERVALYGGRLESGLRVGGGYVVRARLPIREDSAS